MTNKELLLLFERNLRNRANRNGNVSMKDVARETNHAMLCLDKQEKENIPITKFIFVEDGSVDADELIESLSVSNPEIKVVVYRQGGNCPILVNSDGKAVEAEDGEANEET